MGSWMLLDWGKRREVKHQREAQIALAIQNVQVVSEKGQFDARKAFLVYRQAEEELRIAGDFVKARKDAEGEATDLPSKMAAGSATAKAQLDQMQAEVSFRIAHTILMAALGPA